MGRREKMPVIPQDGAVAIGAKIRARRWYQGLTLGQFASAVGDYDQSHLSHIENGRNMPSPDMLAIIVRALDITVEDLNAATTDEVQRWLDSRAQRDTSCPRPAGTSRRDPPRPDRRSPAHGRDSRRILAASEPQPD